MSTYTDTKVHTFHLHSRWFFYRYNKKTKSFDLVFLFSPSFSANEYKSDKIFYLQNRLVVTSVFKCFDALGADDLILEFCEIFRAAAEYAGGLILLEDDLVRINVNLNGVPLGNRKCTSKLDGEHDSS